MAVCARDAPVRRSQGTDRWKKFRRLAPTPDGTTIRAVRREGSCRARAARSEMVWKQLIVRQRPAGQPDASHSVFRHACGTNRSRRGSFSYHDRQALSGRSQAPRPCRSRAGLSICLLPRGKRQTSHVVDFVSSSHASLDGHARALDREAQAPTELSLGRIVFSHLCTVPQPHEDRPVRAGFSGLHRGHISLCRMRVT